MVCTFRLSLATLLICAAVVSAQTPTEAVLPVETSLCALAQNPEAFNGKMVRIRASAMGATINNLWIDDFEQRPTCSAWMGVIIVLPEQIKPQSGFDLVRDIAFQQFCDRIRSMNVQATFEGRFDAIYTWKEQKRVWIPSALSEKGFGKKGRYGGRIVLYRISDVVAHYNPRR